MNHTATLLLDLTPHSTTLAPVWPELEPRVRAALPLDAVHFALVSHAWLAPTLTVGVACFLPPRYTGWRPRAPGYAAGSDEQVLTTGQGDAFSQALPRRRDLEVGLELPAFTP